MVATNPLGRHLNSEQEPAVEVEKVESFLELADDRPLWTRQPEESDTEWAWFQLYRSLHPANRSIDRAYRAYKELRGEEWDGAFAPPSVRVMHATHHWARRAEEWDIYIDLERNAAVEEARVNATMEVAELGRNMRKAAAIAVKGLFNRLYTTRINPETGEEEIVFKEDLSPSAIVQLAKTGVELERLALGMDDKGPGISINIMNAISTRTEDADLIEEAKEVLRVQEMQRKVIEGEFLPLTAGSKASRVTGRELEPASTEHDTTQRQKRGGVR
jgi:hypothetical protein